MPRPTNILRVGLRVALVTLALSCKGKLEDATPATPATTAKLVTFNAAQVEHGGVKWAAVAATTEASMLEVPGQIVPNEDRMARLGAPARGRVLRVNVVLGDRVSAGQPLVTIQSPEASAARADYDKAVADLASSIASAKYARAARERAERLLVAKAIARQDVERAQADDDLARSALTRTEAEVEGERSNMAQLGVTTTGGAMVVSSPLAGVVLSREAVPGAVVEAGAPLVSIADPSSLVLDMHVPDRAAPGLVVGARVRFVVPAFPLDTFEARIRSIGSALEDSTRTLPIRATVASTKGRLRAAMFATAWIDAGDRRPVLSLPEGAIQMLDEKPVAFVAIPDGKGGATFERRDVQVGTTAAGRTQVVRGIKPGELVVSAGAFAVKSEFSRSKMAE